MPYTAGDYLVRVELGATTDLPRDKVVNDFAFRTVDEEENTNDAVFLGLAEDVMDFYNVTPGAQPTSIAGLLSHQLSRVTDKVEIKVYSIVVGLLGPPVYTKKKTLGAVFGSVTDMPSEVAIVNSIHADLEGLSEELPDTSRPASRHRGRQFLGPFTHGGGVIDTSVVPPRVHSEARTTITLAAKALQAAALADGFVWSVWSRAAVNLFPVTGGWVDNDFDTLRARQQKASARTTWTV